MPNGVVINVLLKGNVVFFFQFVLIKIKQELQKSSQYLYQKKIKTKKEKAA